MWSVRIQGIDISIGNWMRRPIVSSRKNSRNQSWERSQHCCSVSETRQNINDDWPHPIYNCKSLLSSFKFKPGWGLTTEVEQVSVEEGLAVKLLNVNDGWPLQTATQSFLKSALISDQRLQHRPDHIQLSRRTERRSRWKDFCLLLSEVFYLYSSHITVCSHTALHAQTHISILFIISPQVVILHSVLSA